VLHIGADAIYAESYFHATRGNGFWLESAVRVVVIVSLVLSVHWFALIEDRAELLGSAVIWKRI